MEPVQPPQHAGHTRPLEPFSPSIGEYRPRKAQRKTDVSPDVVPYGGAQHTTNTVALSLQRGIEATVTESRRTEQILKDFATQSDNFSAKYTTQQDQLLAEEISKTVAEALVGFYQIRYGAQRANTNPHSFNAPKHATYADKVNQNGSNKTQQGGRASKTTPTKPSPKSREDRRVLVTLPAQALLQREDAFILKRQLLAKIPGLLPSSIKAITPTLTGWAISVTDLATRDSLVTEANMPRVLKTFGGKDAFTPEKWYNYAVPNVPTSFISILNPAEAIEVTSQLVTEEVLAQLGESPVRCSMSRHGVNPLTRKATWIVSFKKEARPFHLFSSECSSKVIEDRPRLTHHSNGCQEWCNPLKCHREAKCNNCGTLVTLHGNSPTGNQCKHPTKCAICFGPHKAGYEKCPAKPRTKHGKIIRLSKPDIRNLKNANALIADTVARARSTSPEVEPTPSNGAPETQNNDSPGGAPTERSSSPTPTARKRGAAVDRHERASTAPYPPRPSRQAKPTSSLNLKTMSRNSRQDWSTPGGTQSSESPEGSQDSTTSSNPFSVLASGGMDIDSSTTSS